MRATDAATAIGFGGRPDRQGTQLLDFRPILKGKLLGFAKVELPIGLRISDIPILAGKTASLPRCRQDLSLISKASRSAISMANRNPPPSSSGATEAFPAAPSTRWLRSSSRRTPARLMGIRYHCTETASS